MTIKLLVACREEQQSMALCTQLVQADACIAAEATDVAGARVKAAFTRPDVLLLEHTQDEAHSLCHVLSRILEVSGGTRVVLLCDSYPSIVDFMRWGASGCLPSSAAPSLYAKAVRTVHAGKTWFGRAGLLQPAAPCRAASLRARVQPLSRARY